MEKEEFNKILENLWRFYAIRQHDISLGVKVQYPLKDLPKNARAQYKELLKQLRFRMRKTFHVRVDNEEDETTACIVFYNSHPGCFLKKISA